MSRTSGTRSSTGYDKTVVEKSERKPRKAQRNCGDVKDLHKGGKKKNLKAASIGGRRGEDP